MTPPAFDFAPRIAQTREPVPVQAFVPQSPVEALRISVLRRLAGLDQLQSHPSFFARSVDFYRLEMSNPCPVTVPLASVADLWLPPESRK